MPLPTVAHATAAAPPIAHTLAGRVAALLPDRAGSPWTVEPYRAWWTVSHPAARLVQGGRALVLVARAWDTQIGWQLPDREPTRPDLSLNTVDPARIAREVLRLVLPVVDDETAAKVEDTERARHWLLYEIGAALRAQGVATYERAGFLVNTATVTWGSGGVRHSATLHGSNPACHVQLEGPVRAVERAVALFLPKAAKDVPLHRFQPVRGRLESRMASFLGSYVDVEQTDRGGIAFGSRRAVYGYAAPASSPAALVQDSSPVSVELHGVGADFLISLAPQLTR